MADPKLVRETIEVLGRCAEFLEARQDVDDGDDGVPRPNEAMSLLTDVDRVIAALRRREAAECGDSPVPAASRQSHPGGCSPPEVRT